MLPPPEPTTDPRPHRLAWWIGLGLLLPLLAVALYIAYRPQPSPLPFRQRAIELMKDGRTPAELSAADKARQEFLQLDLDMEAIRIAVVEEYSLVHGPPPANMRGPAKWDANPAVLIQRSERETTLREVDLLLARRAFDRYAESDIFDRACKLSQAPGLWEDVDSTKPLTMWKTPSNAISSLRHLALTLAGAAHLAARDGQSETTRLFARRTLQLSGVADRGNGIMGRLIAQSFRHAVATLATEAAANPTATPEVLRAILDEMSSAPPLSPAAPCIELEQQIRLDDMISLAHKASALDRLANAVTRRPNLADLIDAIERSNSAVLNDAQGVPSTQPLDLNGLETYTFQTSVQPLTIQSAMDMDFRYLTVFTANQIEFDAARIVLAIRLYQLDHDATLPPSLSALVPTYLAALPTDPLAPDKQFRYLIDPPPDNSFTLYSVGSDATDNHANGTPFGFSPLAPLRNYWQDHDAIFYPPPPDQPIGANQ